jgi:hypothetical protein
LLFISNFTKADADYNRPEKHVGAAYSRDYDDLCLQIAAESRSHPAAGIQGKLFSSRLAKQQGNKRRTTNH